ncbi:MAG: helix-turn-helix transcriptional regulator [Thermodesulfobacteriota bacterium]|nr:helix-turn-helix transcriptional regulator [Thermodesulfobacteriota bacterium]
MNRLKEIRARRRVTQFELRLKTGIHQSKISLAENDYVQLEPKEQKKIAKALSVSVGEIWGQGHHAH